MANAIKHLGIVENISGSCLKVRIVQTSACSACSVKGHCSVSDSKEKLIDVYNLRGLSCRVGGRVMISGSVSMGMKAVLLAFVLPFVLLVGALFACMGLTGGDEALSAVLSLSALVPYYGVVYLLRGRLGRTFAFTLESVL